MAASAAALVTGVSALFFGSHLIPRPTGDGKVVALTTASPDFWIAASLILVVASLGLVMGVSSLSPLLRGRGFGFGVVGRVLIVLAGVILFGFAQQLILLRALSIEAGVSDELLGAAMHEPVQQALLVAGFFFFYSGEVCLGIGFLMARSTPRWVPWALIAHVVLALTLARLDKDLRSLPSLLMVAGFLGAAVTANRAALTGEGRGRTSVLDDQPGH